MSDPPSIPISYDLLTARLRDAREALLAHASLPVGTLVRWKRGLQQNSLLNVNGLAVVVGLHETPVLADDVVPQSSEYGLRLDVELGALDAEGLFFVFWTGRSYLESAEPERGQEADLLRSTYAAFVATNEFRVGQAVVWKPQCATPGPEYAAAPAVMVELLEAAAVWPATSRDRDFRQPVDAAVAVEDPLCAFRIVWTDRRRLAPYGGPSVPPDVEPEATPADVAAAAASAPAIAARLLDRHARLLTPAPLTIGMLVQWKPGLRDRLVPMDADAAVVMGFADVSLRDPTAAVGSPVWGQPLSVTLGCMGEDGHFVACHYDARRFEPLSSAETEHRAFLENAYSLYHQRHSFRTGDLVEWKPGLVNRKSPMDGGVAIIVQTLDPAVLSEQIEGTSPYFREPLSLVVGLREEEGFMLLHVDGARFQPTTDAAASEDGRWLRARLADFDGPATYALGTLVEWKEGMCIHPQLGQENHGIVLEALDPPLVAVGHSAGSAAFGIPHSLVVGFFDDDGELRMRYLDGRRVRPVASSTEQDEALAEVFEILSTPHDFRPGQIVAWHPGLRGEAFIDLSPESPGIVLGHLHPVVLSPQANLMSEEYGARADLLVGGFDVDGDFAVVHADSRRLQAHASQHGDAARRLRGFRRRLRHNTTVHPGMLVAWKDRFCTQVALPSGVPGIVLEVLNEPVVVRNASVPIDSPAFAVPWNTVVGVWSETQLLRVHCDSHRLEPFEPVAQSEILRRRTTEEARRMEDFSRMLEEFDEDDPPF